MWYQGRVHVERGIKMIRADLVLAVMSAGRRALHTPVQVQKLFFLIDRNIADQVGGPYRSANANKSLSRI
jgi:hypothetical protein